MAFGVEFIKILSPWTVMLSRSEASLVPGVEILRCAYGFAQDDNRAAGSYSLTNPSRAVGKLFIAMPIVVPTSDASRRAPARSRCQPGGCAARTAPARPVRPAESAVR